MKNVIIVGQTRLNLDNVTTYRITTDGDQVRVTFNFDGMVEVMNPKAGRVVRVNSYAHKCDGMREAKELVHKIDNITGACNV